MADRTTAPAGSGAVFLDRDGTILEEVEFLHDPAAVRLLPGAAAAIRRLNEAHWPVVLVTNQSGIARGLYGVDDFYAVERRLDDLLRASGAHFDAVFFCPHHPDFTGPCECRKPGTKLFRDARTQLGGIDFAHSWFVGDRVSDVTPARTLLGRGLLVRTGYGSDHAAEAGRLGIPAVTDLTAAVDRILS